MNYGKRSHIPKRWKYKEIAMSDDQSQSQGETRPYCKRNARNLSEKKRRDQFNVLILELCSMVSTSRSSKMDKSAILKATISFLKQHNEMANRTEGNTIKENWRPSFLSDDEFSQLMLEALNGFVIVYSQQGHILYASDSIISLLRHLPKELQSSTIYELVHEDDRPEIFKILMEADSKKEDIGHLKDKRYNFTCRMRKGSLEPNKNVQYETVTFNGNFSFFKHDPDNLPEGEQGNRCCFVATACLQNSQLIREMTTPPEKEQEFASRHSLDWKFLFLDHRGPPVLGYLPFEVLGTSVYEYYHQDDLEKLTQCHEALMQTGEGLSCYHRYLSKGQEWIWLQTRYFITYNQWNSKPEFIVCTHRVVSYAEVRKGFNQTMTVADDASMSEDIASLKWNTNSDCMSEMSLSLQSSSSEEQSTYSKRGIMSDKIYSSARSNASGSEDQLSHTEPECLSSVRSAANSLVSSVPSSIHSQPLQPLQVSTAVDKGHHVSNQLTQIQVKLQKQLITRHQKLQEDIMRQQHELQNVQQQLLHAQELIFRQSPFLGMSPGAEQGGQKQPLVASQRVGGAAAIMPDQPFATSDTRGISLPMHHSSPISNHSSPSSPVRGISPYPAFGAPLSSPQGHYHTVQSPAAPSIEGGRHQQSSSSTQLRGPEPRLAFPDLISNICRNETPEVPSQLLRFDPEQNTVIGMPAGPMQQHTSIGTNYSHMIMGNPDQEMSGFMNPNMGLCDDLELDPAFIPGFMD